MDDNKKAIRKKQADQQQEELFYDGEKYYTREEFFNPEDEDKEAYPNRIAKWLKFTVISLFAVALISNILAIWPKIYNSATIEFLTISRELSKNKEVQRYKESVVIVRTGNSKGTGFYFSNEGYIMTNYHVIANEPNVTVTFQDGKTYPAEMINSNRAIDIAILKIDTDGLDYPVLTLSKKWKKDQPIYIIGNPLMFSFIANQGNVLGLTPDREIPMLILDAPVYKGNSGSPVINDRGEVIGVVYATSRIHLHGKRIKVGLAIPSEYVQAYMKLEEE